MTDPDLLDWQKIEDRFIPEPMSGCWLWIGHVQRSGHGSLTLKGKTYRAHRLVYSKLKGELPKLLRHTCNQPSCVNPDHLVSGSQSDNMQDSIRAGTNANLNKMECPKGHPYTESNTKVYQGRRFCRTCARDANNTYREKRKNG